MLLFSLLKKETLTEKNTFFFLLQCHLIITFGTILHLLTESKIHSFYPFLLQYTVMLTYVYHVTSKNMCLQWVKLAPPSYCAGFFFVRSGGLAWSKALLGVVYSYLINGFLCRNIQIVSSGDMGENTVDNIWMQSLCPECCKKILYRKYKNSEQEVQECYIRMLSFICDTIF